MPWPWRGSAHLHPARCCRRRLALTALLSLFPALRGPLLAHVGAELCQADLAFARQDSRVLARYQHEVSVKDEEATRMEAMEGLPAMAEYRARQLDERLVAASVSVGPRKRF